MEFVEVMKQMKRMCAHFSPTCNGCKLCLGKGTDEFCGEAPRDILSDPALVEAAVMSWAAENPEPQFPTWGNWLAEIGLINWQNNGEGEYSVMFPTFKMCEPIPADMAEKLGIEPKGES